MLRSLIARRSEGFTLVELLVVVSIIAILSFTVVTNLGSVRGKARDAKLQQDLSEVDKAVTLYIANDENLDTLNGLKGSAGFDTLVGLPGAASPLRPKYIPSNAEVKHPVTGKLYMFKGTKVGGELKYFLCAELEAAKDPQKTFFVVENGSSYTAKDATVCTN